MPAPQPAPGSSSPDPAPLPKRSHPLLGKTLARCVVGERIGRGATSAVFRARYQPLDRDVALKVLSGERALDPEARSRFLAEAKTIARLDHENIVKVLDVAEDRGALCILMELVDGETVQDRLDDGGALPEKEALRVALDVARALEYAHAEDVVHRDIKPANFIQDRKSGRVKVVDFGLAAKQANNRVGTPLYMSPEAAQGKRIDDRSDVYALGVSLYQMLTGRHPFTGASVKDILAAHVNDELVPPSRARRDLGTKYDALLAKLLVKAKGYRPSAADVVEMLEPLVGEPHKPGSTKKGGRRGGRRPSRSGPPTGVLIGVGAVVVLGLVLLLALRKGGDGTPGAANAGGTPAVKPPVTPPPDPEAPAKAAYLEAEQWAEANREDYDGQARRWGAVEKGHPGTTWGTRAGEKRAEAEKMAERKRKDAEAEEKARQERETREAERRKVYEEIPRLVTSWDFEAAASRAQRVGAPEGMNTREWRMKIARLEYLGKEFVPRLDEALKGTSIAAEKVKPQAGPDARIVGADRRGLLTDAGGTAGWIAWSEVKPGDLFQKVAKKSLSQMRADDCLFLAVLAAELGMESDAKTFREGVIMVDAGGESRDRLKDLFVID